MKNFFTQPPYTPIIKPYIARDNVSLLEQLEEIRSYLTQLLAEIDDVLVQKFSGFEDELSEHEQRVEDNLSHFRNVDLEEIRQNVTAFESHVNDTINGLNDEIMESLLGQMNSKTSKKLRETPRVLNDIELGKLFLRSPNQRRWQLRITDHGVVEAFRV